MNSGQRSAVIDRTIPATDPRSSGSAARQDRRVESVATLVGIVGPIALGLGAVAIRLAAFLRNSSLSLDEAALARNIIDRPWSRLVGWLDYSQLAPPGFLLVEKAIISVVGSSEYALRAFPFFCAVLSVWLCWILCHRLLRPVPALMAFGLFGLNTSVVDFGMRVKPYSGDIAATIWILLVAIKVFEAPLTRRRAIWLALAGAAAPLFSFPSVFILAAITAACLYRARREPSQRDALLAAAAVWTIGAGCGVLIAKMSLSPADSNYMRWFWKSGFMPFPPKSLHDLQWLEQHLKGTFRWTLLYRGSVIWIASSALGIWSFASRRERELAMMLTAPLILVIGASAAQFYPFYWGRVQLFLIPTVVILAVEGADWWRRALANRSIWISTAPTIVLIALGLLGTWSGWRIQRNGDLRSIISYVKSHWQPDDKLFVHYAAGQVFLYYAPRFGFTSRDYMVGSCSDDIQRSDLWEVERFREKSRVWFVAWGIDETALLVRYLTAIGDTRDTYSMPRTNPEESFLITGAAILYDLDKPASRSITPRTFKASDSPARFSETPCYGVFRAMPVSAKAND